MKIVLVDDNKVIAVYAAKNVEINGKNIKYKNDEGPAELNGVLADFYVVEESYEIDQELSDEELDHLQSIDKKEEYIKLNLEEENQLLKERLRATEMAVLSLLDFI